MKQNINTKELKIKNDCFIQSMFQYLLQALQIGFKSRYDYNIFETDFYRCSSI